MKIKSRAHVIWITLLPALMLYCNVSAQQKITLTLLDPFPVSDFGDLTLINDITKAPRAFYIELSPDLLGKEISLGGRLEWKDFDESSFQELAFYRTIDFQADRLIYYNDELGKGNIRLDKNKKRQNSSRISDNIKKGKPAGSYRLTVELFGRDAKKKDTPLGSDTKEVSFINPAQTLTIRTPEEGASLDGGNVLAEWDPVNGAGYYTVRANIRRNHNQSPEDAIQTGNPVIRDKNVGNITSANLRTIMDREWKAGDEVVLQVTAHVPGYSTNGKLYSNIISFHITNPNSQLFQTPVLSDLKDLLERAGHGQLEQVVRQIMDGTIKIQSLKDAENKNLSDSEVQEILQYLLNNPDKINSIGFNAAQ